MTTIVGLMSGTSHDAIDAAAVEATANGDELVLRFLGMVSTSYPKELDDLLVGALPPASTTFADVCRLDTGIGQAFAGAAARAIDELCGGHADLIVSHGQTVYHWVEGNIVRGTLQIGQPAWIAEHTGTTVVADLRSRDVAAGGQGAPLVSAFDVMWLRGLGASRAAAVNLGGIANATIVTPDRDPIAFDTGPANALIDAFVTARTDGRSTFDTNGTRALLGHENEALLARLLDEPYYRLPAPKTTGKELFHGEYVDKQLAGFEELSTEDVVATLTRLTARTVAEAIGDRATDVILSGGGTRNPALVAMIAEELPAARVRVSDELGLPSAAKESIAFAVLGLLTVEGYPGSVPSCTGARGPRVLGTVVPGLAPVPSTLPAAPARLRIEAS
ncbi:anhydro-N-acetylmuramic acid kinase [Actinoplanes solisilvae]|uniref:anhydro-N-acetylmuramic acid kinase n=1 Tax=Actinoplanes solisilvae TaxID=2486853 RepID=UPI000FD6FE1F|nr:anhydro-N-acetylmuramic acid kinase [Actinoplanes solisilvae]